MPSMIRVAAATAKRNITADFHYKFDFIVQALWSLTNMVAFAFLGAAVGQADSDFSPVYPMMYFFVISAAFWTLFSAPYEEASVCLREEASRGTMGFLITNDVNPFGIIIARYVSACFKFIIVFCIAALPILAYVTYEGQRLLPLTTEEIILLSLLLLNTYVFMLALSALIGVLGLLFKNTQTISKIALYGTRIVSTYFTPLLAFGMGGGGTFLPRILFFIPATLGLAGSRRILIEHDTSAPFGDSYFVVIPISFMISIILLWLSKKLGDKLTKTAMKKGTLEMY
ncbi:MAG: hypothetical protein ACTSYA_12365 [Candidatus Kariarchaeaceae archaeon]